jgi:D-glycero-alpha-D-manno-heptose-7-phosphate kinase
MMKIESFVARGSAPIQQALQAINHNKHGLVFVSCDGNTVKGVATDGDIRRHLLSGGLITDPLSSCTNKNFYWERAGTSREVLLKKLDSRIRVIPLLNDRGELIDIFSRDLSPAANEGSVYARARAPVRISFAGGGSDLTRYFSSNTEGAVINATISVFSHALLRLRDDKKIIVKSLDLNETLEADNLREAVEASGKFGLIQAILKLINPEFGFELYLHSDFPLKSGLGGSAVVSSTVLGCFNQFRRDQWDLYELAELAYQAERHHLGISGGWQDQYATVFGGINFMEFRMEQNLVHPLRIQPETLLELEESLVLCDTGISHESGDIQTDQEVQMTKADIRHHVESNVLLSYQMRNELLKGRLREFGKLLDQAWRHKRQVSQKVSNRNLDDLYDGALSHGALGGKLLGAGGGGFFLFFVPPYKKYQLLSFLKSSRLNPQSFRFEEKGLQAWSVRESKSHPEL